MSSIRPLEPEDLPSITRLYTTLLAPTGASHSSVSDFLRATLIDQPWADPEIPSLVYVDDTGRVVGLIGSNVRRMQLDGSQIRVGCCAHLAVEGGSRDTGAGAFLLRRYMSGPQDLTVSDTATHDVARMWQTFGGSVDRVRSIIWMQVFRPWRWVATSARRLVGHRAITPSVAPVSAFPFKAALAKWRALPSSAGVSSEPLTVEAILEHLPEVAAPARLRPHYDQRYLEWLFQQLAATTGYGSLVRRLVRRGPRVLGWYVYYLRPGHRSRVIQIAASRGRDVCPVLVDLVQHAQDHGAALLSGRVEPQLTEALRQLPCVLGLGARCVFHAHDPAIVQAIVSGDSLMSRMDGEWWP